MGAYNRLSLSQISDWSTCVLRTSFVCLGLLLVASFVLAETPKPSNAAPDPEGRRHSTECIDETSEADGIGVHKLPGTTKKLYSYNVDAKPGKEHKAICVSHSKMDTMLWHHGDGTGCFTIEPKLMSSKNEDGGACPAYPFTRPLPDTCVHTHHSERAKKDAIGCSYDMVFHRENGDTSDPHIVVGK